VNNHGQQHGAAGIPPSNFTPAGGLGSRGHGPYSPPPRQGGHGQMYPPPAQRGRGGRNAGAPNYHRMSLPNNATRLPPVQTQFPAYEFPIAPMSAMPYQPAPYWDHMVMTMLKQQIEYYFSIDNLCKDLFLRQRMDTQGFVPLHFVLAFQRIRDMQADMGMVRAVCEESNEIDYVVGDDDGERLRRRHGWETFVLPIEERDELARTHGPAHVSFKNRSYNMGSPYNGMASPPMHFHMGSPQAYTAPPEQTFQPFANGPMGGPVGFEPMNGKRPNTQNATQLSANVPDFAPSGGYMANENSVAAPNGGIPHQRPNESSGAKELAAVNGYHNVGVPNGMTNGVHAAAQSHEAGQS
jgi:la-related protein 1